MVSQRKKKQRLLEPKPCATTDFIVGVDRGAAAYHMRLPPHELHDENKHHHRAPDPI
jgi:hypothetical protein